MDQNLSQLVEELTTSGEPRLNPEKMKELKKICKSSEEQLSHAHRLLMTQLAWEHAEVRLSAFQILEELFARSHHFRLLVVADFQELLELTLGTDHEQPLPPPREAAQRLRQAAIRAVEGWNAKFGEAYKKLAVGYHFLRHTKKVDFQDQHARTVAERRREEEKQKHLDKIHRERAEQAAREMEEASEEIQSCLTEVNSCFRLLLPFDLGPGFPHGVPGPLDRGAPGCSASCSQDEDEEQPCCSKHLPASGGPPEVASHREGSPQAAPEDPSEEELDSDPEEFVRSHGLGSHKYTLDLELSSDGLRVLESEDNTAVMDAARDALKLIHSQFLPAVGSWVQRFTRVGTHGTHLRRAIDLKSELELALLKGRELDLEPTGRPKCGAAVLEDEEEDEDFVEVPDKEGFEAHIPAHLRAEYGLEPEAPPTSGKDHTARGTSERIRTRQNEEVLDPTSAAAQLQRLQGRVPPLPPSSTLRVLPGPEEAQKLAAERARAPVVPFGVDLCHWGEEQPVAGKILKAPSEHRFWKPSEVEEEVYGTHISEGLCTRRIPFAGSFTPVQHRCRAPRPDGRLCERQDRLKCPFHGKIIPRDDQGRPLDPEDRAREQQQQLRQRPDWRDPNFMRDVEAATGEDLGSSRGSRRGQGKRRRKYPSLTDLKSQANTARARIGKKVFAKAAVRRVVTAMNQMDRKKHEKFANQFNYALT
ncbi:UV-stimulated scaffold protein A isoform X1 [Ochotona curzoniae]|uniref:UV-stimulated scaffold protein A isoform X1 n=1 Tax=Ochotona curzoniae TaxID=130825 RepID=UPI001B3516D6|nr:UV-stimulated scaffold protein A isoform X1 [Ochotona curzoniae]XP_040822027.1 UV-stimulated scaffold protein A isoform X1 [Ochotona curzoniae]